MEYNICIAEKDKSQFIATLEDLYKNNSIPFTYTIVNYTLESTYLYEISLTITCSEESLIKIMEFSSSINNIVAICISNADGYKYRKIVWYYDQEIGKTIIEYNSNLYSNFKKMEYAYNASKIYPYNASVYCIQYDDTYKIC